MEREKFPDTLHAVFKAALAAAPPDERPSTWHLNAKVRPVFPARAQIEFAMQLATRFATDANRAQVANVLAAVRSYLLGKHQGESLRALAAARSADDALGMARNAAGACATLARGKPDLVHTAVQAAAAKAVRLAHIGEIRALLEAIDQEILCCECEAAFATAGHPSLGVERVLWRGSGENKKTAHFIARLRSQEVAGTFKLARGKATWALGPADDVIACVPQMHFSDAVAWVTRGLALPASRLVDMRPPTR